jgi:hypothetical protein
MNATEEHRKSKRYKGIVVKHPQFKLPLMFNFQTNDWILVGLVLIIDNSIYQTYLIIIIFF